MYDASDPRSRLAAPAPSSAPAATEFAAAESAKFYEMQPQATGTGAFCIATSPGGALNCKYASLAASEKDAKPQNLNCSPNPKKSTTGSKQ